MKGSGMYSAVPAVHGLQTTTSQTMPVNKEVKGRQSSVEQ